MASAKSLKAAIPGFFTVEDVKGTSNTYTISKAGVEQVGRDKEEKPVLRFLESQKAVVVNKTRSEQLEDLFGEADLLGKKVKLVVREVDVNGRTHEMICIDSAEG